MTAKARFLEDSGDGIRWYSVTGIDYINGETFINEMFGLTDSGRLLDCEGSPLDDNNGKWYHAARRAVMQ